MSLKQNDALLAATGITKSFDGVVALRGVSLELGAGEVHALVGENGAGKSTLIKVITGAIQADEGQIELSGKPIDRNSPRLARSLGIAAIYQQPALFHELTVAENIALGLEQRSLWSRIDWRTRRRRAADLLRQAGANIDVERPAGDLTMPEQQLVEIARAIGTQARILIMDEPTASLSQEETRNLFEVIAALRARGAGIIYVSHRLEELALIADRVTVLRDGCVVATRPVAETEPGELIRLMVGRELSAIFPERRVEPGEVVLELRGLGCRSSGVSNASLAVRAGETVGLAGLVGAGRTELGRCIFGLTPSSEGQILVRGKPVRIGSPAEAIKLGIAYLPEDRQRHGVIPEMAVGANISLASLDRLRRFPLMDFRRERAIATDYVQRFSIRAPTILAPVSTLSGGNQQKVALSRWLAIKPSVLILDEPTQGIDVGAKAEIHGLISELAAQGTAILMISSDLQEVLGMSDRIAVMRSGRIVGVVDRKGATQQEILMMALGQRKPGPVRQEP